MTAAATLAAAAAAFACLALPGLVPDRWRRPRGAGGGPAGRAVGVIRRLAPLLGPVWPAGHSRLDERIVAAGSPFGLTARDLVAIKSVLAAGGGGAALVAGSGSAGRGQLALALLLVPAGFLAPQLWLGRRLRRRGEAMARELPDILDLVRVGVDAGLSMQRAMASVAVRFDGPLARELRRLAVEEELGLPRARALEALARRSPAPEVVAFARAVHRAERHGVPLADALAAQARAARQAHRRRAQEAAAKAGPKIQLVVALLLVPSVLLLTAAVLVAQLMEQPGILFG